MKRLISSSRCRTKEFGIATCSLRHAGGARYRGGKKRGLYILPSPDGQPRFHGVSDLGGVNAKVRFFRFSSGKGAIDFI